jgi:asparagine synthase (glutamine-hydrolysing)
MCGIAGAVWTNDRLAVSPAQLDAMTDALEHRGPDDRGIFYPDPKTIDGIRVGLGFRRLSIIDVAGGHQPLGNEDNSIQIIFNGEIYNFPDLRRRLEAAGHRFRTDCDTETIVHLYEDLGVDCFEHLNGMFAIAIWDSNKRQLVLARDRFGKKPLYYAHQRGRLAFASELKSLTRLTDIPRDIDPSAIDQYLTYQYVPHPLSIYKSIRKLAPGHVAIYKEDNLQISKFWKIDWSREIVVEPRDAMEQVRTLLTDAVKIRLRSDVPLGAFLSGGIDSSLIVAIAQKQLGHPVKTFSIGFDVKDFDETHYAQQVADHVGTEHHRFEISPTNADLLDTLVAQYDEPFSDSSAMPTWYLSQMTRAEVTVALSGDGGDEVFAGYERYRALQSSATINKYFPIGSLFRGPLGAWLRRSPNQRSLLRRIGRFGEALGQPPVERYMNWIQIFGEAQRGNLYREDFIERLPPIDPVDFVRQAWRNVGDRDLITRASLGDLQTYLPCDLMTKVDIASMAHSLEVRQPLLDYRLVEYAASLPSQLKWRGRRGKRILQDAFGDLLPAEIWTRKKMGFGIPIAQWFRGALSDRTESMLVSSDTQCREFFREEALSDIVSRHMNEQSNEGYRLWNLLMLELWLRKNT